MVKIKAGVDFKIIAPAGYLILDALKRTSQFFNLDLTITSACDGVHLGPTDPHYTGEAYDVRSHNLDESDKTLILEHMIGILGPRFYMFLENPGKDNEHFHIQRRNNTTFSVQDYLNL